MHLLDDLWLLTIGAILIATGLPWLVSDFELNIGMASWGLLGLGAIHVAFTTLAAPARRRGRARNRMLTALNLVGVCVIAFVWQHVGAFRNPLFLMVFALPVMGSIFLSRWQPFLVATVSLLAVGVVALAQAPELRWYASGLIGNDVWLNRLFGPQSSVPQASFAGFYAPSSYLMVLLEVFAVLLYACAFAAEYLGTIFERLNAQVVLARIEAERGQELWVTLIEQLPLPALLVDPDTTRIVSVSQNAEAFLQHGPMPLEGRNLFDALRFSFSDMVQELVTGADGRSPPTVIRVGDRLHMTQVRVVHVAHKSRRLALLILEDITELFCVRSALDTSEYASLVVDSQGRIMAFNKPAAGLFGNLQAGKDVTQLLTQTDTEADWWDPGLTRRRKLHLQIGPRIFQVTSSAVTLAGEEEPIFTVSLLPVAKAGSSDPFETQTTMMTSSWRSLR